MAQPESALFYNLCMVSDTDGRLLVIDRKKEDWPGVTFPGGHVEHGESFTQSVIREVWEETGLKIEDPVLCGIKQFQTEEDARYVVLFYKATRFSGHLQSSSEGEVFWVFRSELGRYNLSVDLDEMIRIFDSDSLSEFYYYQEDGKWKYKVL